MYINHDDQQELPTLTLHLAPAGKHLLVTALSIYLAQLITQVADGDEKERAVFRCVQLMDELNRIHD